MGITVDICKNSAKTNADEAYSGRIVRDAEGYEKEKMMIADLDFD
jgi:hypothetical protein